MCGASKRIYGSQGVRCCMWHLSLKSAIVCFGGLENGENEQLGTPGRRPAVLRRRRRLPLGLEVLPVNVPHARVAENGHFRADVPGPLSGRCSDVSRQRNAAARWCREGTLLAVGRCWSALPHARPAALLASVRVVRQRGVAADACQNNRAKRPSTFTVASTSIIAAASAAASARHLTHTHGERARRKLRQRNLGIQEQG